MTMEWITGVKLTTLPPDEIRDLVGVGQEAFLVQLLEVGFFHGDPHPGNLLKVRAVTAMGLVQHIAQQHSTAHTAHTAQHLWFEPVELSGRWDFATETHTRAPLDMMREGVGDSSGDVQLTACLGMHVELS
jgi:hypothetical protein